MKTLRLIFACMLALASVARAEVWSDTTFVGSVYTQGLDAVAGISAVVTNGGSYTNAQVYTNTYRICATNAAGRIPLSTNISIVWMGGASSNAVRLTWTRKGGIYRHVVERSLDAGASWTNYLTLLPGTNTWLDNGSNTWTVGTFTNDISAIPAASYPWGSSGDVTALQAQLSAVTNSTNNLRQTAVDQAATNATARGDVAYLRADGSNAPTGPMNGGGQNWTNMGWVGVGPTSSGNTVDFSGRTLHGGTWTIGDNGGLILNGDLEFFLPSLGIKKAWFVSPTDQSSGGFAFPPGGASTSVLFYLDLDLNGHRATNAAAGVESNDLVTFQQLTEVQNGAPTVAQFNGLDSGVDTLRYRVGRDELSLGELALVVESQYDTPPFQFSQADYFRDQTLYDAANSTGITYSSSSDDYILSSLGYSCSFDGSAGFKTNLSNFDATAPFSISGWFKTSQDVALSADPAIAFGVRQQNPTTNPRLSLGVTGSGYGADAGKLYISDELSWNEYGDVLATNVWYFGVVSVSNGVNVAFYTNAVLIGNHVGAWGGDYTHGTEGVQIGYGYENPAVVHSWEGNVYQAALWDHWLTISEQESLYAGGVSRSVATNETGLIALWKLEDNSGLDAVGIGANSAAMVGTVVSASGGPQGDGRVAFGRLQSTTTTVATNCTSGSLQILADTSGYEAGTWNTTPTSLWALVSGDNGTTFTNANLAYVGRWANTNSVSLRGSFDYPVAGSQLVYRVYWSNSAPARVKGSIIWGVP